MLQLRPCDLHVRDGSGVFQTGPIPGGEARLGYWMKDGSPHSETGQNLALNKSYCQIVEGIGRGPIRGLTSVVTMHVISRRMILTNNGDGFWSAVNVSKVLGDDRYSLSSPLNLSVTWWMLILRMKLL